MPNTTVDELSHSPSSFYYLFLSLSRFLFLSISLSISLSVSLFLLQRCSQIAAEFKLIWFISSQITVLPLLRGDGKTWSLCTVRTGWLQLPSNLHDLICNSWLVTSKMSTIRQIAPQMKRSSQTGRSVHRTSGPVPLPCLSTHWYELAHVVYFFKAVEWISIAVQASM